MDSQAPPSDYSLDNISVIILFFSMPPICFFIVLVITHCYQHLCHGNDLDPKLPDLEAGQGSLARPPSLSTIAVDHNCHNLGRFRNKIRAHRLVLPVDREYHSSTTNIHGGFPKMNRSTAHVS